MKHHGAPNVLFKKKAEMSRIPDSGFRPESRGPPKMGDKGEVAVKSFKKWVMLFMDGPLIQ